MVSGHSSHSVDSYAPQQCCHSRALEQLWRKLLAPKHRISGVQVSERALAQTDAKAALRAVMRSWLPLSEAVLGMAVEQLPDPITAAPERLPRLLALSALDGIAPSLSPSVQQVIVTDLNWQSPWQGICKNF